MFFSFCPAGNNGHEELIMSDDNMQNNAAQDDNKASPTALACAQQIQLTCAKTI